MFFLSNKIWRLHVHIDILVTSKIIPIASENISSKFQKLLDADRIIEMAWEDRTPFEAIEAQFDLKEKEVIRLMRSNLHSSSYKMWRKRVSGRKLKHGFPNQKTRFKSPNQKWKLNC